MWDGIAGPVGPAIVDLTRRTDAGAGRDAVALRERLSSDLTELLTRVDGAPIVAHIGVLVGAERDVPFPDVQRYGAEARLQYLAAVALSTHCGAPREAPTPHDIAQSLALVRDLFEIEKAIIAQDKSDDDKYLRAVRHMLRMEHLEDRFLNFGRHQREIADRLVPAIAPAFEATYGWAPGDLVAVAEAASTVAVERSSALRSEVLSAVDFADFESLQAAERRTVVEMNDRLLPTVLRFGADDLASASGVDAARIARMLTALSPEPGTLDVRYPSDENPFRVRGAMPVDGDEWVIPLPYLWLQELFNLVDDLCQRAGEQLRVRWLRARDRVTEAVVVDRLSTRFGSERVMHAVSLVGGEQGETDVVVDLGDDVLIVECKAHALTAAGRRGAPARVERKTRELLEKSFDQIDRMRAHLEADSAQLQPRGRRRRNMSVREDAAMPAMLVSFERVDPLMMNVSRRDFQARRALAVSLGDFMSMCDVLDDPSSLWHYVRQRSELLSLTNIFAVSELEFLGMYVESGDLRPLAAAATTDSVVLHLFSQSLNEILAVPPGAFAPPIRQTPPARVRHALSEALETASTGWTRVAGAVHDADAGVWRAMRRMRRKANAARTSKRGLTRSLRIQREVVLMISSDPRPAFIDASVDSLTFGFALSEG